MGQTARYTETLAELTALYAKDFPSFARDELRVKPKDILQGALVPFELNQAQRYAHEIAETQLASTGSVRVLVLKGRQQGMSTYIEGRAFHRVTFFPGISAFVLTHEMDATNTIFEMVERFYQNVGQEWRHQTSRDNAKQLDFANQSGYRVATAGTKAAGRSKTLHFFHGSESAFWPNAEDHAAGVLQAVPSSPGTEVWLESTANGLGGYFYEKWKDAWAVLRDRYSGDIFAMARDHRGYIPVFVPWYWQDEYRHRVFPDFRRTDADEILAYRYGLDDEQLMWRLEKIKELGEDLFHQEYPFTPHEAFLLSGRPFFDRESLLRLDATVRPPIARGVLEQADKAVRFIPRSNGWLEIWERPDPGTEYVIGVDVCEGLDDGDKHCGQVLSRGIVMRQVARFAPSDCQETELGRRAVLVANYYHGRTPLGIEREGPGLAAVRAAQDTGYAYLYWSTGPDASRRQGVSTGRAGWSTNVSSRHMLCSNLASVFAEESIVVRSEETANQLRTFVRINGKPQHALGCNDDDVMALGIAVQMALRTQAIRPRKIRAQRVYYGAGTEAWMA